MKNKKKTIDRVSYTNKATIPASAPYSNLNPSYTITREYEVVGDRNEASRAVFDEIKAIVDGYIECDYKTLMLYGKDLPETNDPIKLGHRVTDGLPHVTNIITPDRPQIPNIDDHAKLGLALDLAIKNIIDGKEITEYTEKLAFEYDWKEMLEGVNKQIKENYIKFVAHSIKCVNETHRFCGELDAVVSYMGGKYILDLKKTKKITKDLREKYFKQIAAYASTQEIVEGGIILTPYEIIVESNLQPYWEGFLIDRGAYRQRFNI